MTIFSKLLGTVWVIFLLVLAVAAIGTELDFSSRTSPQLAKLVPEPFQAYAKVYAATEAIEAGDGNRAMSVAGDMLKARPVPAENLTLFALAAGLAQQNDLSANAVGLSAQRGWRETIAQVSVLAAALDAGEWTAAAQRIDALMRTGNAGLITDAQFQAIMRTPEGRQALAERLAAQAPWAGQFLDKGATFLGPTQLADIVQLMEASGTELSCAARSSATRKLLQRGEQGAAKIVWGKPCAAEYQSFDTAAFVPPGEHEAIDPFGWAYPSQPGLRRTFGKSAGQPAIDYRNRDILRRVLASRYMTLASGTYTMSLSFEQEAYSDGGSLWLSMKCQGEGSATILAEQRVSGLPLKFSVPGNCRVQSLRISVERGGASSVGLTVIQQNH